MFLLIKKKSEYIFLAINGSNDPIVTLERKCTQPKKLCFESVLGLHPLPDAQSTNTLPPSKVKWTVPNYRFLPVSNLLLLRPKAHNEDHLMSSRETNRAHEVKSQEISQLIAMPSVFFLKLIGSNDPTDLTINNYLFDLNQC